MPLAEDALIVLAIGAVKNVITITQADCVGIVAGSISESTIDTCLSGVMTTILSGVITAICSDPHLVDQTIV